MTESTLQNPESLRAACEAIVREMQDEHGGRRWVERIAEFIDWFRKASEEERATEEFQRRLWDENPVAAIGQGNIDVSSVIEDPETRRWMAKQLVGDFGSDADARREHIKNVNKQFRAKLQERLPRMPQAKLFRVYAVAFPSDFSTIADGRTVKKTYRAMFGRRAPNPVPCSFEILTRLEEVLGAPGDEAFELAVRMTIPWKLYEKYILSTDEEATEEVVGQDGGTRLVPLPAARRRRGLTIIKNGLDTVMGALDFIEDGVGKDEFVEHLRTLLPSYKASSFNSVISTLSSNLGLIKRENDLLVLTDRGQALLDSGDPSELADWLLTRILGVDAALVTLRDDGPKSRADLLASIRVCNPGRTTDFGASGILSWLKHFGVVEDSDGEVVLTEVGREWADRIHWAPAVLKVETEDEGTVAETEFEVPSPESIRLPDIEDIISSIQAKGHFDARMIRSLHAGLWSDKQRHFAVLSGLSGTGKTLLAKEYGAALRPDDGGVNLLSVQPGWYDAGAVLGYVNPLRPDAYTRTGFLEFLIQAIENPNLPHVAILDEMNLSHPEQYLAPILSAMEGAGGRIELHQEGNDFDGVPQSLSYPPNLVLIGTVNMDETTHGLSDKVLDRAFTIEFWDVDVDAYPGWADNGMESSVADQARVVLKDLYDALRPGRLHFGWRTIGDVLGFLRASNTSANDSEIAANLDSIVYAKVLPKLRGDDSPRFRKALERSGEVLSRHGLDRSAERLKDLEEDLDATGTARFWR